MLDDPLPDTELRVLVVDDNVDAATTLSYLLQLLGCRSTVAVDVSSGLRLLRLYLPQLVFVDLNMPGADGIQLRVRARDIETLDPRTLFVCLTADDGPENRARCLAEGFDWFVTKPMQVSLLDEILQDARSRLASRGNPGSTLGSMGPATS